MSPWGHGTVDIQRGTPPVVCDGNVVEKIADAGRRMLGVDKVIPLASPSMGSEDFAHYLEHIPGAMFRIGTSSQLQGSTMPLHNNQITFDEQSIPTGAMVMAEMVKEYLK